MRDDDGVRFLQEALPGLGMRWPGFRKPRRQVLRRIDRRVRELGLPDLDAYRARLDADPAEWAALDALCRVTISRFLRDRHVWDTLAEVVLPALARDAGGGVRAWSAGCASGEEPFSLAMVWRHRVAPAFPDVRLDVLGTDADATMVERARGACWPPGSLREVSPAWRASDFLPGSPVCLRPALREGVRFEVADVRGPAPPGPFHLVLCRNLAFTYFDVPTQRATLDRIRSVLVPGGALVLGRHETLPEGHGMGAWVEGEGIWREGGTALAPRPTAAAP